MSDPTRNEILVDPGSLVQAPHAPTGLINENFEPDEVAARHEGPMKSHKLSWVHLEDSVKSFGRKAHVMTQQVGPKVLLLQKPERRFLCMSSNSAIQD